MTGFTRRKSRSDEEKVVPVGPLLSWVVSGLEEGEGEGDLDEVRELGKRWTVTVSLEGFCVYITERKFGWLPKT